MQVLFYETIDGKCLVLDFIRSLDKKMQAKVLRTIDLLQTNGKNLREPISKAIGNGIFELRMQQGSDISRILYFFYVGNCAILTNGFVKKTSKTPPSEITLALNCKKDYERRNPR